MGHGDGAAETLFRLGKKVHARDMGHVAAFAFPFPGDGMPVVVDGQPHEGVVGGMKLHFVDAAPVAVEGLEPGRVFVGQEAQFHVFVAAHGGAQLAALGVDPVRAFAADGFGQRLVGFVGVVVARYLRLVGDGVGGQFGDGITRFHDRPPRWRPLGHRIGQYER